MIDDKKLNDAVNDISSLIKALPLKKNRGATKTTSDKIFDEILDGKSKERNGFLKSIQEVINTVDVDKSRLSKYDTYDAIVDNVQLIKKIIKVYTYNIIQPDITSNNIFIYKPTEKCKRDSHTEIYRDLSKKLIQTFNFEDLLRSKIIPYMIRYGDCFIEIKNLKDSQINIPKNEKKLIVENSLELIYEEIFSVKNSDNLYKSENKTLVYDEYEKLIDFFFEAEDESVPIEENINLKNIMLRVHKPHRIIPIINDFNLLLGYLEIKQTDSIVANNNVSNPLTQFVNVVNSISATGSKTQKYEDKRTDVLKKFTSIIIKKILTKYKIHFEKGQSKSEYLKSIKDNVEPEILIALKQLATFNDDSFNSRKKINVRFIFPQNMVHYSIPGGENHPYGLSMVDSLVYPGKFYLLTQLANAITKLSRSALIRKWTLETGARKDIAAVLQKFEKNLRNQRTTAEDFVTAKNIPQILSDFKDIITFKKKGQTFIDMDIQQTGDPSIGIRDLEDIRQELIAISGVPASFIGYERQENKDNLINVDIIFAIEISNIQTIVSNKSNELFDKLTFMSNLRKGEIFSDYMNISLLPPTILMVQLLETIFNSVSNMQRILTELPDVESDPSYLLRKFVPYIDWDEFRDSAKLMKQKIAVSSPTQDPNKSNPW